LAVENKSIPKALACDNFIGYAHRFLIEAKVTWLEATIAAPVFSGLVTYYIEGQAPNRHNPMDTTLSKAGGYNLMDTPLSHASRSWGVRGNIFSFLLPWEQVLLQLFEKVEDGDLSQWPLSPATMRQVVRVRFVRGPAELLEKFRDLYVRSAVVKNLAEICRSSRRAENPYLGKVSDGS
jgi:hypothetical protein